MEAKQQLIAFVVLALLVGTGVGVGIGSLTWNDGDESQTYWFYIDYGDKTDDAHKNGWVSVTGTSTADAVKKIPGVKTTNSTTYGTSLDGINGIENETTSGGKYWAQFIRNGDYTGASDFEKNFTSSNFGLGNTYCTCMYLFYSTWGTVATDDGWMNTGPFKK